MTRAIRLEDRDSFVELYQNPNVLILDIARKFKIHPRTVAREARRLGLKPIKRNFRRKSTKPFTEEEWEQFRKEFEVTATVELAERYRVSPETIKFWASQKGFSRSKPAPEVVSCQPEQDGSYEQLLELVWSSSRLIRGETWTPPEVDFNLETELPIALVFTADWHLGSPGVDYEAFDETRRLIIETEGVYAYVGGDGTERFVKTIAGPQAAGIDQQPITIQRLFFIRAIESMMDKIVAFGTGNHEEWSRIATGFDELANIARRLNFVYTGPGGLLNLTVGKQTYRIFRTHRFRFTSSFNLTHAAKQCWRLGVYDADIVVVEHRHEAAIESFMGHGLERIAVRTGTFLVYDDYARRFGFYGAEVANPTIILFPFERKMISFKRLQDAVIMLRALREQAQTPPASTPF